MFRYDRHNSDVAKSTSDIITEKQETEQKQQQQTSEMNALQKIAEALEENLQKINKEIEDYEKKIEDKNAEMQTFINSITSTKEEHTLTPAGGHGTGSSLDIISVIVPFLDSFMGYISKMVLSTSQESMIRTLQAGLSELNSARQRLKEQEWDIQNKLMDNQLHLAKLKIENGENFSVFLLV